jgi:hypothetical protein
MEYELSDYELGIIQNGYLTKSSKQLALLIDCPVSVVDAAIHLLAPEVKSKQQIITERIAARPAKIKPPKKERVPKKELRRKEELRKKVLSEKKQRTSAENEWRQQRQGNLNREANFKNKAVDYSDMVLVKIDRKTSFYVKKGENIAAAKERFLKMYSKSLNTGNELA